MKTIETNNQYRVVQWDYPTEDGKTLPITFREYFNPPRIQAKFDDNFAVCNGYRNIGSMVEHTVGLGTMLLMFGGVPDWIDVDGQGKFMFIGSNPNLNLN